MCEGPLAASERRFCRKSLSPEGAAQVVSDFVKVLAIDLLPDDATIADEFRYALQLQSPKADAVLNVTLPVSRNPLLDSGAIVRSGIIAHGFRIGQNLSQSVGVFGDKFAQQQPWGLEDRHHCEGRAGTLVPPLVLLALQLLLHRVVGFLGAFFHAMANRLSAFGHAFAGIFARGLGGAGSLVG